MTNEQMKMAKLGALNQRQRGAAGKKTVTDKKVWDRREGGADETMLCCLDLRDETRQ